MHQRLIARAGDSFNDGFGDVWTVTALRDGGYDVTSKAGDVRTFSATDLRMMDKLKRPRKVRAKSVKGSIAVSDAVRTVIETDVLDHYEDDFDDGYDAIRAAWNGSGLSTHGNLAPLLTALGDLANACDENSEHGDAEERKVYRRATKDLSALIDKIKRKV